MDKTPNSPKDQYKDTNSNGINPVFIDLNDSDTFLNHFINV